MYDCDALKHSRSVPNALGTTIKGVHIEINISTYSNMIVALQEQGAANRS